MRSLWHWCLRRDIIITPRLIPSAEDKADNLSRQVDHGDYTLNLKLFQFLRTKHGLGKKEIWDMFASAGNKKFPRFVTRFPHWQASRVDALTCSLEGISRCYANPPWKIIHHWLLRLLRQPKMVCWLIVPYWVSAMWCPLLVKMQVPKTKAFLIDPFQGMFKNCLEVEMPPPQGGTFSQ